MRRGSGAGEAVPPSATTVDSVAASPPSDKAGMIDPSIEDQCYSQHRAGASDFVAAGFAAVLVAILRDAVLRTAPQDEVHCWWTRITPSDLILRSALFARVSKDGHKHGATPTAPGSRAARLPPAPRTSPT